MTGSVAPVNAKAQELSCANVITQLNYLEGICGAATASREIEKLGLPIEFLRDKKNWVSYEYFNRFLDTVVSLTGDAQAPFKAPLAGRPQEVFEYLVYATQSVLWYGVLSIPYRLILGSNLYKRWIKIGEFDVVSTARRSMRVRLILKEGYRQTRNNCLAIQGMLACIPMAIGMQPAEVSEIGCAVDGGRSCEYLVKWTNLRSRFTGLGALIFIAALILEVTVFRRYFGIRDVVISVLSAATIGLTFRSFRYWRNLRQQERVSLQRNQFLVDNLEQLEQTKAELLERNEFLSIVSSVSELVTQEANFVSLLSQILPLLTSRLGFDRGDCFRLLGVQDACRSITNPVVSVPYSEFERLTAQGPHVVLGSIDRREFPGVFAWVDTDERQGSLYLIPVSVANAFSAYYCFFTASVPAISPDLIASLFVNVADQLKIGYAKIASRSTIASILTSIPEYVLIFGAETFTIHYANKRFIQSYPGLVHSQNRAIVGAQLFSVLHVDDRAETVIADQVSTLTTVERPETYETSVGSAVLEFNVFPMPQSADSERLAGIILSDITDQKSFYQKMLISEKLLALGRVASGIAHEINNPLYAVLANAEEITEDDRAGDETRRLAAEIIDHVDNISAVVRDLSTYSKAMRRESPDDVDLNQTVEDALKLVRYGSDFLGVEVDKRLDSVPTIRAIRGEIQQILINLINNAVWAMKGNGTLVLETRYYDDRIIVAVGDSGVGIPPENLQRIFHYLFTTKEAGEGTGQGLSIVDRLTRRNHGRVEVESTVGVGTTFRLTFPVESGDADTVESIARDG
jgi:signal transduction histidine kinase